MTGIELAYLILSLVAFAVFGAVLYSVERYCRPRVEQRVEVTGAAPPSNASTLPVH
jgi:hypothetical protein